MDNRDRRKLNSSGLSRAPMTPKRENTFFLPYDCRNHQFHPEKWVFFNKKTLDKNLQSFHCFSAKWALPSHFFRTAPSDQHSFSSPVCLITLISLVGFRYIYPSQNTKTLQEQERIVTLLFHTLNMRHPCFMQN